MPSVTTDVQAAFELLCPNIIDNPYLGGHWPMPAQARFLGGHLRYGSDAEVFQALYGGAAGGGKALDVATPIPTPDGWTTMGDLAPGDLVFDEEGRQTTVLACSEPMAGRDCFALTTRDGEVIVADADHRWRTTTVAERSSAHRRRIIRPPRSMGKRPDLAERNRLTATSSPAPPPSIKTTRELAATVFHGHRTNHAIPVQQPLDTKRQELLIRPYTLGLWLGDGTSASGDITIGEAEGADLLTAAGETVQNRPKTISFKVIGLRAKLVQEGLLRNKHIPPQYLRADIVQRLALLQGLCDSDGHAKPNGAVEFTTTSPPLRDGILELLASLGIKARAREGRATLDGKDCGPKWRIVFLTCLKAFRLARKLRAQKREDFRGTHEQRWIESVTPVESRSVRCIQVLNESGMFLCGRSMLPTHNSDALLMAAAQYAWNHDQPTDFAAVLFRRTFVDLTSPGALLDRALEWWVPAGVQWQATKGTFLFPSGAKVSFAHLSAPTDHLKYQGAEYQLSAWDELTQWPDERAYEYVGLSRLRRKSGSPIPLRTLAASNPGGPGHAWVQRKFVGGTDPETGDPIQPQHPYEPARIQDNPYLDRPSYIRGLSHMHPTLVEQLLRGDWSARDPGDYFRAEWFGELLDPDTQAWAPGTCSRIRWWDLAASEKPGSSKTAGVRMARHHTGVRAVEHCRAGRWTPGKRDDIIVQTAQADGKRVTVGIEIEGGSGGLAQFLSLERRLKAQGFRVVGARPRSRLTDKQQDLMARQAGTLTAKTGRADPVAACLERGYLRRGEAMRTPENERSPYFGLDVGGVEKDGIRLYRGPWTQSYLDAIEGFPPETGKAGVDEVDATSGAWAWLEAHPPGMGTVPLARRPPAKIDSPDVHPENRPQRDETGKDRRGRWRP